MEKNVRTAKVNIPMSIACVLLCLTLVSLHLTSGLYAKYSVSADGEDFARVMSFGDLIITETGDFCSDGKMMIIPGVDLTKKAVVSFSGSEAASYVFVEVILSSDWTTTDNNSFFIGSAGNERMRWEMENGWTFLETDNSGTFIFYCELPPNTPLFSDIISADGRITVSDKITKQQISGMTGISISFRAAAAQANGFDGPADAWESIASK